MTAINVIRQARAVHMITDGAAYDASGRLLSVGPKAWPLPHLNAVIAARGPQLVVPLMVDLLAHATDTFDGLESGILELAKSGYAIFREAFAKSDGGDSFELTVAGFSESRGPTSFLIANHDRYPNVAPWKVVPLGAISIAPASDTIYQGWIASIPAGLTPDDLDIRAESVRLLEIQRSCRVPVRDRNGHDSPQFCVGGLGQLTTVTPNGITVEILRRWNDPIGQTIDPRG